jgi:GNAT superfamily N-acetyltransferase
MTGTPAARGNPQRSCSLLAGVGIERGTREDWLALAPLHYRSHHAGAVTDIFKAVWERSIGGRAHCGLRIADCELNSNEPRAGHASVAANPQSAILSPQSAVLIGVIVYSRSPLSLAARNRATGGRYCTAGLGRVATGELINRELRIISRVVVAPNWRGLGLAIRLVAETLPLAGTPYVEALAAMGQMHPLFVRAGMTAYPQSPSKEGQRLRAALEAAGLGQADRRSADRLAAALESLAPPARALAEREIARWARSYLGAKNHRINRPDRRRRLDLVVRHLDAAPVYYLWRAPQAGPAY